MLASAVVIGLAAGLLRGGRLSNLQDLRVSLWPVLLAAVLIRLLAGVAGEWAAGLYVAGFLGVVAVAIANWRLAGAPLIAIGAGLNLLVVAVNGAMPISLDAVAAVGGSVPRDPLHVELRPDSRLPFFADVVPVPLVRTAYSLGDLFLAVGGLWLSFRSVKPRP